MLDDQSPRYISSPQAIQSSVDRDAATLPLLVLPEFPKLITTEQASLSCYRDSDVIVAGGMRQ